MIIPCEESKEYFDIVGARAAEIAYLAALAVDKDPGFVPVLESLNDL